MTWPIDLFSSAWVQNVVALFITFGVALAWLRLNNALAERRLISRDLSRKLIHIGTGPLFIVCWLFFADVPQSRWLAALVPGLITLQFALIGLGVIRDEGAVQAMSRSGNRRELLYGPLQYGIVFVLLTVLYWLDSPVGIVVLLILCAGDGASDVVGRRFGSAKLPWNPRKSWAGSLAMLAASVLSSLLFLYAFTRVGVFDLTLSSSLGPLLVISLVATLIEAVSGADTDNVTVTVAALGTAWLLTDATKIWNVPFLA